MLSQIGPDSKGIEGVNALFLLCSYFSYKTSRSIKIFFPKSIYFSTTPPPEIENNFPLSGKLAMQSLSGARQECLYLISC